MIFVIDDDAAVRDSLKLLLEAENLPTADFSSGAEFMRGEKPGETDCVILDINMPDMDGFCVLQRLRRDKNSAPVIVMTGDPSPARTIRAMSEGARFVIEKPFDRNELLDAVHLALDRA